MVPLMVGAGLSIAGGLLGGRSAKRAAAAAERQARERAAAFQRYGTDAVGRMQTAGANMPQGFRPWNVRTGRGGWNIDPTTGTATAELDPTVKAYQDWTYGASQTARDQLGAFDRQAFAQQEYDRGRGLLQEGRSADLSNLLGMLQRKGIAGFGQTPVGGTSTMSSNPLLNSFIDRQNRQDLELLDRSYGAADTQMDRLTKRATGMFDAGYGLNDDLMGQLEANMNLGQRERERGIQDWQRRVDFAKGLEDYYRTAALGGMEDIAQAQQYGTQARLGRDQAFANMLGQAGAGFLSGGLKMPTLGGASLADTGLFETAGGGTGISGSLARLISQSGGFGGAGSSPY